MRIIIDLDDEDRIRDKAGSLVEICTRILDHMVQFYAITVEEE